MKLFEKFVHDIICTVRADPDEYLKLGNKLKNHAIYIIKNQLGRGFGIS